MLHSCLPSEPRAGAGERTALVSSRSHLLGTRDGPPYLTSSYVSPRSGLNGLPVLSHWEATAETAKAATDCKQSTGGLERSGRPAVRHRGSARSASGSLFTPLTPCFPRVTCLEIAGLPATCLSSPAIASVPQRNRTVHRSCPTIGTLVNRVATSVCLSVCLVHEHSGGSSTLILLTDMCM